MIKVKLSKPLPEVIRRVMVAFKLLMISLAGLSLIARNELLSTGILALGYFIDFMVDLLVGEDPIIQFERLAKEINHEVPNTMVTYEIYQHDIIDNADGMDSNQNMDSNSNSINVIDNNDIPVDNSSK